MKLRNPLAIRMVAACMALILRLWLATVRVRIVSADGNQHPADPAKARYLYIFWHEGLLAPLKTRPRARVLISQHADGELIAQVCQRFDVGVVRGSSARGGVQALLEMIRGIDEPVHLAITPDGPRGPRRELQLGTVMVASQTGLPIVPIGIGFVRAWRAASWDRFAVPLPFSTMIGVLGEAIVVPKELDRGEMRYWREHVEQRLLTVTEQAEAWAQKMAQSGSRAEPPDLTRAGEMRQSA